MWINIDTSKVDTIQIMGKMYSYHTVSSHLYAGDSLISESENTDNANYEFSSDVNASIDVASVDNITLTLHGHGGWRNAYTRFEGSVTWY